MPALVNSLRKAASVEATVSTRTGSFGPRAESRAIPVTEPMGTPRSWLLSVSTCATISSITSVRRRLSLAVSVVSMEISPFSPVRTEMRSPEETVASARTSETVWSAIRVIWLRTLASARFSS